MKLNELQQNPHNPRTLSEEKQTDLLVKVLKHPDLMRLKRIRYDSSDGNKILGGNQRHKILTIISESDLEELYVSNGLTEYYETKSPFFKSLIKDGTIPKKWTEDVKSYSEEDKLQFIVIDNHNDGDWVFEILETTHDKDKLVSEGFEWEYEMAHDEEYDDDEFNLPPPEDSESDLALPSNKIVLDFTGDDYDKVMDIFENTKGSKEAIVFDALINYYK